MYRQNLSVEIKSKIISMRNFSSLTWNQIADQCGCSASTCRYWWKRHEKGESLNEKSKSGPRHVLSAEQEADIIARIRENPFLTAVSFAREFGVADKTISAIFHRHGIKCRTAATELRLSEENRINRIAYCQVLLEEWDENKLESIIFSDETNFRTDISWRSKCYRPDNTRYEPEYLKVKDGSGRVTNNYWGAIGYEGTVTPILKIDGKFNHQKYMRILRSHVIPLMERFEDDGNPRIFMQDNAPAHTAAPVMALFSRQRFTVMEWPPKSPDLNPIENVWSKMEYDWPVIHPRNAENLDAVVQERWDALSRDQQYFRNLYRSIRTRCQQIIDSDGHTIKY